MKIYLIAPRNPESFWTFDRILPSLKKKCVFPNLSLPTVAGLTPREHEIVLAHVRRHVGDLALESLQRSKAAKAGAGNTTGT